MARFETQVGIIGAGPAGLMLSHLLHLNGIGSIVLEARSRAYCEERVRAGVLEHTSVEMLRGTGVAERLDRLGLRHEGVELGLDGVRHRVPFVELTGKCVTVYGQQEVVKDLIARRLVDAGDLRFECGEVSLHAIDSNKPWIHVQKDGAIDQVFFRAGFIDIAEIDRWLKPTVDRQKQKTNPAGGKKRDRSPTI